MNRAVAEVDRQIANMMRIGTVIRVDAGRARAVVDLGDIQTIPLPVAGMRCGALSFWWMPSVGEQVLVGSPSGDLSRGIIMCAIFAGNAPSSNAAVPKIDLGGGTIEVNGTMIVSGDVIASGVSLVNHTHSGVDTGPGNTGKPN